MLPLKLAPVLLSLHLKKTQTKMNFTELFSVRTLFWL